ncbi:MAG: hypothetical protein ACD_79C00739G0003 [uncultured bacterium]|nr:MAG: hypothetical protein ACD_79C00739G0003 [uncultured bacterium]
MNNNSIKKYQWNVKKNEQNKTLLNFIQCHITFELSGRAIKRCIENGFARINNRVETFSSHKLKSEDVISFYFNEEVITPKKQAIEKERILFEDEVLIIYDKPSGVSSSPTESSNINLLFLMKEYLRDKNHSYAALLHRIDKGTSGIVALTKDARQEKFFLEQFKNHTVRKTYFALVDGAVKKTEGKIESFLGIVKKQKGFEQWSEVPEGKGKIAITHYKVIKNFNNASYLELNPLTGRTHQLRVQLSSMGHAILGDTIYGKKYHNFNLPAPRLMLHASEISILHPITNKILTIKSGIPADFQNFLLKLR